MIISLILLVIAIIAFFLAMKILPISIKEGITLFIIVLILFVVFVFADLEIISVIITAFAINMIYVNFLRKNDIKTQCQCLEWKIEKYNKRVGQSNKMIKLNKDFYERFNEFYNNMIEISLYAAFSLPPIIYNAIFKSWQDSKWLNVYKEKGLINAEEASASFEEIIGNNMKLSDLLNYNEYFISKFGICFALALFIFFISLILLNSCTKEGKLVNELVDHKNKKIKNGFGMKKIPDISFTDHEKMFLYNYNNKCEYTRTERRDIFKFDK